jgi:hypothetical protein
VIYRTLARRSVIHFPGSSDPTTVLLGEDRKWSMT